MDFADIDRQLKKMESDSQVIKAKRLKAEQEAVINGPDTDNQQDATED